jgi:hypothetical protein
MTQMSLALPTGEELLIGLVSISDRAAPITRAAAGICPSSIRR